MTTLELDGGVQAIVETSNAWDVQYKLPLVPMHKNPVIYCAYIFKLVMDRGVDIPAEWRFNLYEYNNKCRSAGFLWTLPDWTPASHDELIGWAFMSGSISRDIMRDLENIGYVIQAKGEAKDYSRFIFLEPFLKVRGFGVCSYAEQIAYSIHIMSHALSYKKDKPEDSGTLKINLMNTSLETQPISRMFIWLWRLIMKKKGVTIHKIFSERYLVEVPVFEILSRGMNKI